MQKVEDILADIQKLPPEEVDRIAEWLAEYRSQARDEGMGGVVDEPRLEFSRTPMTLDRLLSAKRDEILRLAASRGAHNVRVFGSVARGEAGEDSDVDLLINVDSSRSLLDVVGLWLDLQELLGKKVDLLTEEGINPLLRDRIIAEARPL